MTKTAQLKNIAATVACLGILLPPPVFADSPRVPQSSTSREVTTRPVGDVALSDGGVLVGQVVSEEGVPHANTPVRLQLNGAEVAAALTDANGMFSVSDLQGGVYLIITPHTFGIYRLWVDNTAPPAAKQGVLLVTGGNVVRGQDEEEAPGLLSNPLVWAAIVVAVATPIAVSELSDSGPSS